MVAAQYRHRAATTGSTGFISLLLKPPEGSAKTRLNTADRVGASALVHLMSFLYVIPDPVPRPGNTPLHLAMESAHAEAACLLILAGADRERVRCWSHPSRAVLSPFLTAPVGEP